MDEKICSLDFQEWLSAFDAVQVASGKRRRQPGGTHQAFLKSKPRSLTTPGEGMGVL